MKKQLASFITFLGLFFAFSDVFAVDVPFSTTSTFPTNCGWGTFPFYKYVGESWQPYDILHGSKDYAWVIKYASSSITAYNPDNVVSVNNGSFFYTSNMKPEWVESVIAVSAASPMVVSGHNLNPSVPAARFIFSIDRRPTNTYLNGITGNYTYTDLSWNIQTKNYTNKPDWSSAPSQIDNECFDLYTRWCGDGLVTNSETCDPADSTKSGWGTNGCDTSCKPINTAISCGDGIKNGSEQCDPADSKKSGWGVGGCDSSCKPVVTPPTTPVCDPARTGVQTSPLTQGYCQTGTPSGFVKTGTNPENYTWSCNAGGNSVNCSANYSTPTASLTIKKYVKDLGTGDTQTAPISVATGETFYYYYVLENPSSVEATKVVVKDTFPQYLTFAGPVAVKNPEGVDVTSDWSCVQGSKVFSPETNARVTLICDKKTPLPANSGKYIFTIPVTLSNTTPIGVNMQNVAYACADNLATNPKWPNGETICGNPNPPPPPPPGCDATNPESQKDPACIVVPSNPKFDLRIKKYVKGEDEFASVDTSEDYNYNIVVQNVGPDPTTGVTTVKDRLPAPITLRGVPTGNGWTCTGVAGTADITCTTSASVTANQLFPVITVPVRVTNIAFRSQAYVNYAYVQNPNEIAGKRCRTDGTMPDPSLGGANGETPSTVCNEDSNNFDPATVNPPNPSGYDLRLKKFINTDDEASRVNVDGTVDYTFFVQNLGEQDSVGEITVTDDSFPTGITISSIAPTQGEWICSKDTDTKFTCKTSRILKKGEFSTTIALRATVAPTMAVGAYRNVACLTNAGDPHNAAPLNPTLGQYKVNNCDPAVLTIVAPGTFDLMLKKYVADMTTGTAQRDGDHQTSNDGADVDRDILTVAQGGKLRYRFIAKNLGPVTATGTTTIEDTLPNDTTITSVNGNGWTCSITGNGNRSFICSRSDDLSLGASYPEIVVLADTATAILAGEYSNVATLRNPNDTNPTNNADPANIEIIVGGYNCGSITASPAGTTQAPGMAVTYSCAAIGYAGSASNLEYNIKCGTTDAGTWSGESTRICNLPASSSTTQITTCAVREKSNPSVIFTGSEINACHITISTTGGGSGPAYVGKKCSNGVATCAYYNSMAGCTSDGIPSAKCYSADSVGLNQCQSEFLSCGWGGGGGGGGWGGGGGGGSSGYCGDGVLQLGEECDVKGAPWCTSCKVSGLTNPGANPLTDLWMTIPRLSQARMGQSWTNVIPFSENRMVLGVGTKAFVLADTVGLGVKTQYAIPLIIEADKKICLESSGNSLNSNRICTTFGNLAPVKHFNGKNYVVLGRGDYQIRLANGTYALAMADGITNVDLFKWASLYPSSLGSSITLNDAFLGRTIGNDGQISLLSQSAADPNTYIPLVSLDVRVSGAMVGNTAGTVNRNIETFINRGSILTSFLSGIKPLTTTTQTTTAPTSSSNTVVSPTNITTTITGNKSVKNVAELEAFAVNGNKNILAVKNGDLTIENCGTSGFMLSGVRSVVVEKGNLILKCNIGYSDATSSFAFIVKGGNIVVDPGVLAEPNSGVSALAGVFVAIDDGITGAGQFRSLGNGASQRILKVDGSMYGDAKPLFDSRLYVRGNTAYEILTTGIILSYSNRALVNPPPLLSQYLNNYSVTRVVK